LSTIQYQAFNREAGSAVIVPGYRAIVNWVKDRMSQEIYARIRQVMAGGAASAQNATMPSGNASSPANMTEGINATSSG
jgi:hypothetical protein